MPTPTVVIEVIQYGHMISLSGETVQILNRFDYGLITAIAPPNKTNFGNAWSAAIAAPFRAAISIAYVSDKATVRFVNDATDPPLDIAGLGNGLVTGDAIPSNAAAYYKINTAKKGKQYRGSKHLSPLADAHVEDDELNATGLAVFATLKTALTASITDSDTNVWRLMVLSSKPPGQYLVNPVVINGEVMTSLNTRKTIGTMRHRRPKSLFVP